MLCAVAATSPIHAAGAPSSMVRRRVEEVNNETQGEESSFVVHRGKTVPTLYNVAGSGEGATPRPGSRVAAIKERFNMDTKAEERGEERSSSSASGPNSSSGPAGVPSNWEDRKTTVYSSGGGRRSRRNSITADDCHLTIENFGGSQDNLSMFGRNPDKEPVTLQQSGMRRPSTDSFAPAGNDVTATPPAGTPSTPAAGMNYWRRNNDRTRSQVTLQLQSSSSKGVEVENPNRERAEGCVTF